MNDRHPSVPREAPSSELCSDAAPIIDHVRRDGGLVGGDAHAADAIHCLAIYRPALPKNAEISLHLKAAGEKDDRGGGVAVRLATPDDYYLVQLDARRDRTLLSLLKNGTSDEIVAVDADIASHTWHTLSARAQDDRFAVSLDGTWMFTGFDKALSEPGRVALWTTGGSVTRFDQIEITPLP